MFLRVISTRCKATPTHENRHYDKLVGRPLKASLSKQTKLWHSFIAPVDGRHYRHQPSCRFGTAPRLLIHAAGSITDVRSVVFAGPPEEGLYLCWVSLSAVEKALLSAPEPRLVFPLPSRLWMIGNLFLHSLPKLPWIIHPLKLQRLKMFNRVESGPFLPNRSWPIHICIHPAESPPSIPIVTSGKCGEMLQERDHGNNVKQRIKSRLNIRLCSFFFF